MSPLPALILLAAACGPATDTAAGHGHDTAVAAPDRDGDGTPDAQDCDPDDPYTHPGADDIPYDGKDNDCAGDGDLVDYDGDGYDGEPAGGDDCNDGNPDIYPGAPEVCYDGIDQDCAGDEDSDDCDGDGWDGWQRGGEDCDDEDPAVHPGAEEIWYDGVDGDCSGNGRSDYDADGDGHDIDGAGGDDCDDTDPQSYAGHVEWWDGVDRDCDGQVDWLDDRDTDLSWSGSTSAGGLLGTAAEILDDLDGDGGATLALGGYGNETIGYAGAVRLLDLADGGGDIYTLAAGGVVPTSEVFAGWDIAAIGDLDGDGLSELAVGAPAYPASSDYGAALLYTGAALAGGGTLDQADALAAFSGVTFVGIDVASAGDMDGDGWPELAVGTGDLATVTGEDTGTWLAVYPAALALRRPEIGQEQALVTVSGDGAGGHGAGGLDADGDGLADLLIGGDTAGDGFTALLRGSQVGGGASLDAGSLDRVTGPSGGGVGLTQGWLRDIDGDGYDEAVIDASAATGGSELSGIVYLVDGSGFSGESAVASVAFATVEGTTAYGHLRGAERGADFDGDGVEDLVVSHAGDGTTSLKESTWILSGAVLAAGGTWSASDGFARFSTVSSMDGLGTRALAADADGDGRADLVLTTPYASGGAGGADAWLDRLP